MPFPDEIFDKSKVNYVQKCAYVLNLIKNKNESVWLKYKVQFENLKPEESYEFYHQLVHEYQLLLSETPEHEAEKKIDKKVPSIIAPKTLPEKAAVPAKKEEAKAAPEKRTAVKKVASKKAAAKKPAAKKTPAKKAAAKKEPAKKAPAKKAAVKKVVAKKASVKKAAVKKAPAKKVAAKKVVAKKAPAKKAPAKKVVAKKAPAKKTKKK